MRHALTLVFTSLLCAICVLFEATQADLAWAQVPSTNQSALSPSLAEVEQIQGPLKGLAWQADGPGFQVSFDLLLKEYSNYDALKRSLQNTPSNEWAKVAGFLRLQFLQRQGLPKECPEQIAIPLEGIRTDDRIGLGSLRFFPSDQRLPWSVNLLDRYLKANREGNPLLELMDDSITLKIDTFSIVLSLPVNVQRTIKTCLPNSLQNLAWKKARHLPITKSWYGILDQSANASSPFHFWLTGLQIPGSKEYVGILSLTFGRSEQRRDPKNQSEVTNYFKLAKLLDSEGVKLSTEDLKASNSPKFLEIASNVFERRMTGEEVFNATEALFGGWPGMSGWARITCKVPETRHFALQGKEFAEGIQWIGVDWFTSSNSFLSEIIAVSKQVESKSQNAPNSANQEVKYTRVLHSLKDDTPPQSNFEASLKIRQIS